MLEGWRRSPAGMPELRDLAAGQLRQHQERLDTYHAMIQADPCELPDRPPFTRTLRMGELFEHACLTFWREVIDTLRPE
nr:PadR family transcriptional regulator [Deinococcus sp. RM]